ncbi:MAG: aldo/keto reductase [Cytophagales bacterium]|nr:aldo/keto reductase [Cytophagales bacterium]
MHSYLPSISRYQTMKYNRCGNSGLLLPAISMGLWHNFGGVDVYETAKNIILHCFDKGITHFDLANNYGPPPGSAEENFGKMLKNELHGYRDQLIISTKAGYTMWQGPYGDWGSKKYLVSSLDQSLKRMGLDYVDIFYHHRYDPLTPMEETMAALALIIQQGKALYIGLSNYNGEQMEQALKILQSLNVRCLINQPKYSMYDRSPENGLLQVLEKHNIGCIPFSPLAQGLLTDKYLQGIPDKSRATHSIYFKADHVTDEKVNKSKKLNVLAQQRGQTLAQMALSWVLTQKAVTTVLIGASKPEQVDDCIGALNNDTFSKAELDQIEDILK